MTLKVKMLVIVSLILALCPAVHGAVRYGEATVQKGNVVVVRNGRMFLFTSANNPVTLFENDTIRTLKNSSVTLYNPDQNRVILGANAVMQLKKWRKQNQSGTIRVLFGKFRARTAALRKRSGLNLRTATATIGIKGSLGEGATNSDFTSLSNLGGEMDITNNEGNSLDIPLGQFAFNVDGKDQEFSLDKAPAYDPGKSEDDMETTETEQLDTEDTKQMELPPVVEEAIEKNIVEVADASDLESVGATQSDVSDFDASTVTDLLDVVKDVNENIQDTATKDNPKVEVKIEFE